MKRRRNAKREDNLAIGRIIQSKKFRLFLLVAFILVLLLFAKKASFYVLFVGINAVIIYYSKLYHLPIDVSPLFFFEIVVTRYYGITYTLAFILFGYIIPKVLAGQGMKWESYAFVGVSVIANLISLYMTGLSLQTVGFITSILQYIGGIFISLVMKPFVLAAADGIANVTNNLIWFLIFSDVIVWLLH
ncbi:TPA: hypothetical protein HA239_02460 [Candidatus Woesearchaeota archaeon]|nr:hypothetical protein QT06_C0001G1094 [archaeon GW2011_AR15]MBS3104435.1 hypothetical protein [Candidatus Woesearchaeota archaeon]HIH41252.1 hypothetical protein [Candidatus Woesearchaeota archaeon]